MSETMPNEATLDSIKTIYAVYFSVSRQSMFFEDRADAERLTSQFGASDCPTIQDIQIISSSAKSAHRTADRAALVALCDAIKPHIARMPADVFAAYHAAVKAMGEG